MLFKGSSWYISFKMPCLFIISVRGHGSSWIHWMCNMFYEFVNLAPSSAFRHKGKYITKLSYVFSKIVTCATFRFVHITSKWHKYQAHDKFVILIQKFLFFKQISSYFHWSQSCQWSTVTRILLYLIKNKILEPITHFILHAYQLPYRDLATGFEAQAYVNYRTPPELPYCQLTQQINKTWYQGLSHDSAIHSSWYQGCLWNECPRTDIPPEMPDEVQWYWTLHCKVSTKIQFPVWDLVLNMFDLLNA